MIPFPLLSVLHVAGALDNTNHPFYPNGWFDKPISVENPAKLQEIETQSKSMLPSKDRPEEHTNEYSTMMDFFKVPFLTKEHLYRKIGELYEQKHPLLLKSAYVSPTGGTSGTSLFFVTDTHENRAQRRFMGALANIVGTLDSDDMNLVLHGGRPMYRSQDVTAEITDNAGGSVLWVGADAKDEEAFSIAQRFHANTVCATPTRLLQLAQWLEATGNAGKISLDKIVFTSEPLARNQEAYLRSQFGTKVVASMYGSAEAGVWAASRPVKSLSESTRAFFFDQRFIYVEVYDFSTDTPRRLTPEEMQAGKEGELVVTSLMRRRNPLLRYRTGDVGRVLHLSDEEEAYLFQRIENVTHAPASPRMHAAEGQQPAEYNLFETLFLPPIDVLHMRKLVLGGRDASKSFHFHGDYVDSSVLDGIFTTFPTTVVPDLEIVSWQAVLDFGEVEDVCEYRLVVSTQLADDVKQRFESEMHERLCKAMELDGEERAEKLVKVVVCSLEHLEKGSMAGKTRKIVDRRK